MGRSCFNLTRLELHFGLHNLCLAMPQLLNRSPELQELTVRWTREDESEEAMDNTPLMALLAYDPNTPLKNAQIHTIRVDATRGSLQMLTSRATAPNSTLKEVVLYAREPAACVSVFATEIYRIRAAGVDVRCEEIVFPDKWVYQDQGDLDPRPMEEDDEEEDEEDTTGSEEEGDA
ncbi:hypothetical protein R3P38DRAFT_559650 [Favolaschia claudopus]|uniref:Uncharacterized protein n=1 Tax=Favolaschia claudopus TaxID=2862362 RepID=A0AAV9Z9V2_9AGAR